MVDPQCALANEYLLAHRYPAIQRKELVQGMTLISSELFSVCTGVRVQRVLREGQQLLPPVCLAVS